MSTWLVAIIGFVYLYIAVEQFFKGAPGTAIMFAGYALANVGLIIQVK
jgi:hypothetical protein